MGEIYLCCKGTLPRWFAVRYSSVLQHFPEMELLSALLVAMQMYFHYLQFIVKTHTHTTHTKNSRRALSRWTCRLSALSPLPQSLTESVTHSTCWCWISRQTITSSFYKLLIFFALSALTGHPGRARRRLRDGASLSSSRVLQSQQHRRLPQRRGRGGGGSPGEGGGEATSASVGQLLPGPFPTGWSLWMSVCWTGKNGGAFVPCGCFWTFPPCIGRGDLERRFRTSVPPSSLKGSASHCWGCLPALSFLKPLS